MRRRIASRGLCGVCVLVALSAACAEQDDGARSTDVGADAADSSGDAADDADSGGDAADAADSDATDTTGGDPGEGDTDTGPGREPPVADYGDAPDGRIQPDGTFDRTGFPTLFGGGGAHTLDTTVVALAASPDLTDISLERDADDLNDPDGEPNFIRFRQPQPDDENSDDFDNGFIGAQLNLDNPKEPVLALELGVALIDSTQPGTYFVNVLFDHNLDGAWNSNQAEFGPEDVVSRVSTTNLNDEWVVKNLAVELSADAPFASVNLNIPLLGAIFSAVRSVDDVAPYMRVALTDAEIAGTAWEGDGAFDVGEIEDWAVLGLRDRPRLVCDVSEFDFFGFPMFDFAGRRKMDLPCAVFRPDSAPAGDVVYDLEVEEIVPGPPAAARARLDCPGANVGTVTVPAGSDSAPLPCEGVNLNIGVGQGSILGVQLEASYDGSALVEPGFDSHIAVALSSALDALDLVNSEDVPPEDEVFTNCIDLTQASDVVNGGGVLQLGFEGECSFVPQDGETDGTFIVWGGQGFRGRGDMGLTELGGGGTWQGSGSTVRATLDGVPVVSNLWEVPVDRSSSQTLAVTFSSRLHFEVRIDVTLNAEGFNTVALTVLDARRLGSLE